ncbi:MAG: hypothetical protein GC131_02765 [Alphaproteobacteria bacterium]|nr:hypothetical protein [Alphaproteobacteria bacterium]
MQVSGGIGIPGLLVMAAAELCMPGGSIIAGALIGALAMRDEYGQRNIGTVLVGAAFGGLLGWGMSWLMGITGFTEMARPVAQGLVSKVMHLRPGA